VEKCGVATNFGGVQRLACHAISAPAVPIYLISLRQNPCFSIFPFAERRFERFKRFLFVQIIPFYVYKYFPENIQSTMDYYFRCFHGHVTYYSACAMTSERPFAWLNRDVFRSRSIIYIQKLSFDVMIAEIRPADPEII